MGRWLWDEERAKAMVKWMLRVVFEENLMSEIGRACLVEIGRKSRWWARCKHICSKFGQMELVNLIWLRCECEWNGEPKDECVGVLYKWKHINMYCVGMIMMK